MSQSDAHRELVLQVEKALSLKFPHLRITIDVQQQPGDLVPPKILGYRPDVYAIDSNHSLTVIAEAKTSEDLENQHTHKQVASFITYLERMKNGCFILSVTGYGADRAKTLLRFMCQEILVKNTSIIVFDSYDFWLLDLAEGKTWLLS